MIWWQFDSNAKRQLVIQGLWHHSCFCSSRTTFLMLDHVTSASTWSVADLWLLQLYTVEVPSCSPFWEMQFIKIISLCLLLPLCSTFGRHFYVPNAPICTYNFIFHKQYTSSHWWISHLSTYFWFFFVKCCCWVKVFKESLASSHPVAHNTILEMTIFFVYKEAWLVNRSLPEILYLVHTVNHLHQGQ